MTGSSELAVAMGLLDVAKGHGFRFARIASGEDGPLLGVRGIGAAEPGRT